MDEIISADEAKGLLAEILSAKLGMEIEPGQIEFVFKKESRTVGFFTNEHTETVQVFQGIRIEKKIGLQTRKI